MQNILLENSLSLPINRQKTEMILFSYDVIDHVYSKVTIHITSYGYSQYRSNTNFCIKLNGIMRILAYWTF